MANILLIGSNPSIRSPDNSPFHAATRSRMILDEWFADLQGHMKAFINVTDIVKADNKPLTGSEIQAALPALKLRLEEFKGFKFVALGKTAARACELAGVKFLEMPHPSGMNRKLNDPEYVKEKIKRLAEFISEPS